MRKPSPAMIVALAALFIALSGVGVAATGGNFILGQSNTAGNTTSLGSGVTTGPTLEVSNSGGKPAARFDVNATSQPFVVSNTKKVQYLNADQLDGMDGAQLVQGRGSSILSNRLVFDPTDTKTLMQVPGLGELRATCGASSSYIVWYNTTADTVDLWISPENYDNEFNPGLADEIVLISFSPYVRLPVATLMLGVGNGATSRVASINVAIHQSAAGATCHAEAQGTVWSSQ